MKFLSKKNENFIKNGQNFDQKNRHFLSRQTIFNTDLEVTSRFRVKFRLAAKLEEEVKDARA